MNPPQPNAIISKPQHSSTLPLKIAGIVFWGMVFIGVLASWLLIKDYRSTLIERNSDEVEAMTLEITQLLTKRPSYPLREFKDQIDMGRIARHLNALHIWMGPQQLTLGTFVTSCEIRARSFALTALDQTGNLVSSTDNWLVLCLPDVEAAVMEYRKNTLVLMGVLFFTFGLLLQAILKRILAAPIVRMLDSARQIHDGAADVRFDDKRDDEFGFLARFINQALDTAEQANRAKSMFLANMSHEIRTPLTAILGFAENLREEQQARQEHSASLDRIVRNGHHLMQIVNDVLDISKIEAKQLSIEMVDTSPIRLISDIDALIGDRVRSKGLALKVHYDFPLPTTIVTDPTRLTQILLNLSSNATKFTESGGIDIRVSYQTESDTLVVKVKDTGIGMNDDELARLFRPFSQADQSTTRKFGGTGLGLHISRQLAQMLGGDLTCKSHKGFGTEFTLTIRANIPQDCEFVHELEASQINDAVNQTAVVPRLRGKVLLAEDHPDNQTLISMYIGKTGADVTVAENGLRVVEAARGTTFDLILMDMQMPLMDGPEALQLLRSRGNKTPVVMLTANALKDERERCMNLGANGFLTKPVNKVLFYGTLAEYLRPATPQKTIADDDEANFIAKLRGRFIRDLPAKLVELKSALERQDWTTLRGEMHKLRGIGGGVGLNEITELCAGAETCQDQILGEKAAALVNHLSGLLASPTELASAQNEP